jgi:hypothetical protein
VGGGMGFEFARGGGRAEGEVSVWVDGWAEGEGKGEYMFSSLMMQKIKGKNCAVFYFAGKRFFYIYL